MRASGLSGRKFYRNKSRGLIGGVCAGIADYFGFNLRTTRFLAVIACLFFWPAVLILYIGTVLVVPAIDSQTARRREDEEFVRAMRSSPKTTIGDVRRRFQQMDSRLAKMERYVTSSRFNLDQEFKNL